MARGTQAQDQDHPEETREACPEKAETMEKKLSMKQKEREKYSLAASFPLGSTASNMSITGKPQDLFYNIFKSPISLLHVLEKKIPSDLTEPH